MPPRSRSEAAQITRIDPQPLLERIQSAHTLMHERADEHDEGRLLSDRSPNHWIDATPFLAAFAHLSIVPPKTLMCLYSAWHDERQSRMMVVDDPAVARREVQQPLADCDMGVFLRDDADRSLPPGASLDVLGAITDDGSSDALFERSMLLRWMTELLNFGHGVYWPRYQVLSAAPPEDDYYRRNDRGERSWRPIDGHEFPDDWRPLVRRQVSVAAPGAPLPQSVEGRADLATGPFDVVSFYALTRYVSANVYRYTDWYRGSRHLGSEWCAIANGGGAYVV